MGLQEVSTVNICVKLYYFQMLFNMHMHASKVFQANSIIISY